MSRVWKLVLGLLGYTDARERRLARQSRAQDEQMLRTHLDHDQHTYLQAMTERRQAANVTFGTTESVPYLVTIDDLTQSFGLLTAATGVGKSYLLCSALDQVMSGSDESAQ